MSLTKKKLNIIEGFGLILILLAFLMQLIQNDFESSYQETQNYHLNKKLDYIWTIVEKDYSEKHPEAGVSMAINFEFYDREFKIYSEQIKELKSWEDGISLFSKINFGLFIIGSLLLIAPKFIEEI